MDEKSNILTFESKWVFVHLFDIIIYREQKIVFKTSIQTNSSICKVYFLKCGFEKSSTPLKLKFI